MLLGVGFVDLVYGIGNESHHMNGVLLQVLLNNYAQVTERYAMLHLP